MELFLDDELPKKIKLRIKDRFQELEEPAQNYFPPVQQLIKSNPMNDMSLAAQSPSMQRIMAQNPDLIQRPIPSTPAAAQALAARQALINGAGKGEKGSRSPRKT